MSYWLNYWFIIWRKCDAPALHETRRSNLSIQVDMESRYKLLVPVELPVTLWVNFHPYCSTFEVTRVMSEWSYVVAWKIAQRNIEKVSYLEHSFTVIRIKVVLLTAGLIRLKIRIVIEWKNIAIMVLGNKQYKFFNQTSNS